MTAVAQSSTASVAAYVIDRVLAHGRQCPCLPKGSAIPIIRSVEGTTYDIEGARFNLYAAPSLGSTQLCAWRVDVPADFRGVDHRVNREEVLLVLSGGVRVTIDGIEAVLEPGDVALVPVDSEPHWDAGEQGASVWTTTTPGLEAIAPDGTKITPPWA